jgi:protocatechuate 3,4-dioxygenase, beta subunit
MEFSTLPLGVRPNDVHPPYKSTGLRGPREARVRVRDDRAANFGVTTPQTILQANDADLTKHGSAEPQGQAITAAGRYAHSKDDHNAPLDPNFLGYGKMITDSDGRYQFKTIKPGAYPWGNHHNAWRPAHIHFSLFGNVYAQRLITQMYFPDDPLFPFDPIFNSIPDGAARNRLISKFSLDDTVSGTSLGFVFDIALRGRGATPMGI